MLRLLTNDNVFLLFLLWTFACIFAGALLHWSWTWLTHWSLHFHTRPSPRDFERYGRALYAANNWHFLLPDSVVLAWLDSVTRSPASSCAPQGIQGGRFDESDLRHVPLMAPEPALRPYLDGERPSQLPAGMYAGAGYPHDQRPPAPLTGGRHHDARGQVLSGCAVRAAIQDEQAAENLKLE